MLIYNMISHETFFLYILFDFISKIKTTNNRSRLKKKVWINSIISKDLHIQGILQPY